MNATDPIAQVLSTFAGLEKDLAEAQKGPMEPKMRAELSRLAVSTRACLKNLGASHQVASEKLATKRAAVAASIAKNKQVVAAKKAKLAEKQPAADLPPTPPPALDPTLGNRLATELLARQRTAEMPTSKHATCVLDQWEWATSGESVGTAADQ